MQRSNNAQPSCALLDQNQLILSFTSRLKIASAIILSFFYSFSIQVILTFELTETLIACFVMSWGGSAARFPKSLLQPCHLRKSIYILICDFSSPLLHLSAEPISRTA